MQRSTQCSQRCTESANHVLQFISDRSGSLGDFVHAHGVGAWVSPRLATRQVPTANTRLVRTIVHLAFAPVALLEGASALILRPCRLDLRDCRRSFCIPSQISSPLSCPDITSWQAPVTLNLPIAPSLCHTYTSVPNPRSFLAPSLPTPYPSCVPVPHHLAQHHTPCSRVLRFSQTLRGSQWLP